MKKEHSKLMEKILQSFDWDSIFEINRVLKVGTGSGNEIVPGVKKKPFNDKITKNDFKSELRSLIKYAIENNVPHLSYGNWIIHWINDDWNFELEGIHLEDEDDEISEEVDAEDDFFVLEPQLEVIYSPQRISLKGEITEPESKENEMVNPEEILEKALKNEDYELAAKIRDIIHQNREKKLDK